jgi:DNA-binding XRE family transcriptional regulator
MAQSARSSGILGISHDPSTPWVVVRPGEAVPTLRSAAAFDRLRQKHTVKFDSDGQEQKRKDVTLSEAVSRPRRLLGHNLRRLRAAAGLSQQGLSDLTGIRPGRISQYETGLYAPTIDMLERFADAFVVPIAALFDETDFDEKPKRKKR